MDHLAFFKDISKQSVAIAGGKGASLGEMTQAGIPVPPGFVVLASAFDDFLKHTGLNAEISARLKEVNIQDVNSIDKASAVIRDAIHDRRLPQNLGDEIIAAYNKLSAEFVAVRSSATAEDSAVASWAGELETYLNTTRQNILERVKQCWSSLFTPRAIFYRHEKNLSDHYVSVAVVIQAMVQSEVSGIAFTVHPVTEDPNQMIIEAGYGLGEAIVSGQITPDSYIVSKADYALIDVTVSEQTRKLERVGAEGSTWAEIPAAAASKQKLSGPEIIELAKLCQRIEAHYGFPCDIEWARANGKFYITQSRPITTLKNSLFIDKTRLADIA